MVDIENLNYGRKQVQHTTNYPLPKKMGQSAYRAQYETVNKPIKGSNHTVFNYEIEADKIFTSLINKNNFQPESKGVTHLVFGQIAEKLEKLKQRKHQDKMRGGSRSALAENIYERTKPNIRMQMDDQREI